MANALELLKGLTVASFHGDLFFSHRHETTFRNCDLCLYFSDGMYVPLNHLEHYIRPYKLGFRHIP